ncbi:hypothetical protein SAMN05428944_1356 [Streptomyces sp. 1222.5]|nr:hypothetical protein BX260_6738 [Streptomyces sp. 5112.2]SEB79308.1 hypothetical protein SAMN05428944_1356 [Streptomyces sp. 1222.5]
MFAVWREGTTQSASDAALAYALAGAFCTGAQPMWMTAIETAGDLLPGWSAPSGVATVPVSGVLRRCCAGLTGDQASC